MSVSGRVWPLNLETRFPCFHVSILGVWKRMRFKQQISFSKICATFSGYHFRGQFHKSHWYISKQTNCHPFCRYSSSEFSQVFRKETSSELVTSTQRSRWSRCGHHSLPNLYSWTWAQKYVGKSELPRSWNYDKIPYKWMVYLYMNGGFSMLNEYVNIPVPWIQKMNRWSLSLSETNCLKKNTSVQPSWDDTSHSHVDTILEKSTIFTNFELHEIRWNNDLTNSFAISAISSVSLSSFFTWHLSCM